MKSVLIEALRSDLETAINKIMRLEGRVEQLEREQAWWKMQDEERERQGTSIDVPVTVNLVEDPDALWNKDRCRGDNVSTGKDPLKGTHQ